MPHPSNSTDVSSTASRRDVLKAIGSGAVIAALGGTITRHALAAAPAVPLPPPASPSAAPVLEAFPLADVRLLEGPFLHAQKKNEEYLLKLEADRMLHNFRKNAGLEPKAPVYGGWESVQTWADIRAHGHTLGHYLTAAALGYAASGNEELKKRIEYIVTELKACQDATKTGLINAFPDNTTQIDNMIAGRRVVGVPWYTLHKVYAGLRDAWLFTGNAMAKEVLVRLTDWAVEATKDMTDAAFERMLGVEHGGMNEVIADVYVITGNPKHLALAERFCHKQLLTPFSEGRDTLNGMHSNTQIPKFVGFERLYQITGKEEYRKASEFFWKSVTGPRAFVTGGNGDNERFFPVTEFASHLNSAKTMETCCSHNVLRLTRLLLARDPQAAYADYYEKGLYNTILASQDRDTGMVTYFQSTRPGYIKLFGTPFDSFWCCTGTGIENHAKYGDSIYFHGAPNSTQKDSLYVNLFIASTLNWKEKGLTLKQVTSFPEVGKTRLEISASTPVDLTLNIRHPAWAASASLKVNGAAVPTATKPGSYISVKRTWKAGDVVELELPMAIRMELLPGTTDTAAVVYGPIVMVGALGHAVKPGEDLHINERTIGQPHNIRIDVPTLAGDLADLPSKIKPAGEPLTFITEGIGRPAEIRLIPYFNTEHQHYNMYWKIQKA